MYEKVNWSQLEWRFRDYFFFIMASMSKEIREKYSVKFIKHELFGREVVELQLLYKGKQISKVIIEKHSEEARQYE